MLCKILKTTVADGRLVRSGAIEDLSDRDATLLIGMGKAMKAETIPPQPLNQSTEIEPIEASKRQNGKRRKEIQNAEPR